VKKNREPSRRRRAAPRKTSRKPGKPIGAVPVTAADLRELRDSLQRRMHAAQSRTAGKQRTSVKGAARRGGSPMRWNPEPEDVQKSVAQLVLTLVEFLRKLMERQAIRRMEQKTLTRKEVEAVGSALMLLEQTVREIGSKFGLTPEDLNLDLGPLGRLM
jgi:gas vesicle protein GvpK